MSRALTDFEKQCLAPLLQRAKQAQRKAEKAARAAQEARSVLEIACALVAGEGAWVDLRTLCVETVPEKVAEADESA